MLIDRVHVGEQKAFAIEVINHHVLKEAEEALEAIGRITVGEFIETFRMDLGFWGVQEYRASWKKALQVLSSRDSSTSCLISSITDPEASNFIMCWPLYRSGDGVYVQNSVIFLDELDGEFDTDEPWNHVGPRCTVDDYGNRISEWPTDILEVRRFLESCIGQ